MRLVIILDDKSQAINIDESDIVLTQNYEYYMNNRHTDKIYYVDFSLADENPKLADNINEMFALLPDEYLRYRNTFYMRVFRPMYSIVMQIKSIIKQHHIDNMVLIGGSEHLFLTLHFAEGEGSKWWYKTSWFLNGIIKQYFEEDIPVHWIKKESSAKLAVINYVRDKLLLFRVIMVKFILAIINKKRIAREYGFLNQKKPVVSIVDLSLQYRHLSSLLGSIKALDPIYLVPHRIKLEDDYKVVRCSPLRLLPLIKLLCHEFKISKTKCKKVKFKLLNKIVIIPMKCLNRSVKQTHFQFCYRIKELSLMFERLNIPKQACIVTDMTFGDDIIVCNELAKLYEMQHFNFQYVVMSKMLFPQIKLADEYYLYSKNTYELYKTYSDSYKYYFPVKMNPRDHIYHFSKIIKIAIFTQPDKYTQRYLYFIGLLAERIETKKLSIQITIKLHYRQDRTEEFEKYASRFPFISIAGKKANCEELIIDSDISISITSSVLFEALMLGKIAAIVHLDGQDDSLIYNNDACFPEVNFVIKSIDEMIDLIDQYPLYINKYRERYDQFMKDNNCIPDYEEIFHVQ